MAGDGFRCCVVDGDAAENGGSDILSVSPLHEVRLSCLYLCGDLEVKVQRAVAGIEACLVSLVLSVDIQFLYGSLFEYGATEVLYIERQAQRVPLTVLVQRAP